MRTYMVNTIIDAYYDDCSDWDIPGRTTIETAYIVRGRSTDNIVYRGSRKDM